MRVVTTLTRIDPPRPLAYFVGERIVPDVDHVNHWPPTDRHRWRQIIANPEWAWPDDEMTDPDHVAALMWLLENPPSDDRRYVSRGFVNGGAPAWFVALPITATEGPRP